MTCDAIAFAVPAVVLMVSDANVLKEPPIFGNLPKADLARLVDVSEDLEVALFKSGSSIMPENLFEKWFPVIIFIGK